MPHVEIFHYPATVSDEALERLERDVVAAVVAAFGVGPHAVSIGTRTVDPADWTDTVYDPLITRRDDAAGNAPLVRRPGY